MLVDTAQLARTRLPMTAAFSLTSCETTSEIASDYDRSANFATYHAFTLMQREHRGIPNPLVAIRAEEEITQELKRNIDVPQYREGTLAIDVFDGRTHRPVWHGGAQKELTRKDLEQCAEPINEAVSSVLAKFPPGRDSSCQQRGSECVS